MLLPAILLLLRLASLLTAVECCKCHNPDAASMINTKDVVPENFAFTRQDDHSLLMSGPPIKNLRRCVVFSGVGGPWEFQDCTKDGKPMVRIMEWPRDEVPRAVCTFRLGLYFEGVERPLVVNVQVDLSSQDRGPFLGRPLRARL